MMRWFLLVFASLFLAGQAVAQDQGSASVPPIAAAPPPPAAAAAPAAGALTLNEGYVLGAGDIIEVSIIGRNDFSGRVQVQVDGTVQLPYISTIPAANRTILQFRDDVKNALVAGGYFANPAVQVVVASYASRNVTVLGEVATPGIVPVDRAYRVSELLARVGGARATAADDITLTRSSGEVLTLDIRTVSTGGPDQDPIVNPGDKLFIAAAEQFYIYGQVNGPGTYKVDRAMTLRMALARGGGLTPLGSERRVRVIRDGQEIRTFRLNDPVRGGDVIVVGERFF